MPMYAILIVRLGEGPAPVREDLQAYARVSADDDLDPAMALHPGGLAIPVPTGGRDVARLSVRLAVHEAEAGLADGSTRILALVETAAAMLALPGLVGASQRLCGIAWDADALARDIGAPASRDGDGALIAPLALARSQVLLAAAAAGVAAVDTACAVEGAFLREVEEGRRDGFVGKIVGGGLVETETITSLRRPGTRSPPPCGEGPG